MMHSPDDIKMGLEMCYEDKGCSDCPYYVHCFSKDEIPFGAVMHDALVLIQQLQADNAEKDKRIRQLEAERDAAVSELVGTCQVCRWEGTEKCTSCHFCEDAWNVHDSNWEWRGAQKEE